MTGHRDILSQLCAQEGRRIVNGPYLNALVIEVGEFGLDLIREVLKYENGRVKEAAARNAALNEELDKKKDENIEHKRQDGSVSKVLRKCETTEFSTPKAPPT